MLSIWVLALLAPAVLTLMEKGSTTYVLNLNEEEQKEKPEPDADQKQLNFLSHPELHIPARDKRTAYKAHSLQRVAPIFEIILPPPEYMI
jgi:hypothetical protein